jgi:ketosteroid isomerase-like protein
VLFDAIPPHVQAGRETVRAVWERCFPYFPKSHTSEHKDVSVTVGGDVAFVHALFRFIPLDPPDHPCGNGWMRVTVGLRRIA